MDVTCLNYTVPHYFYSKLSPMRKFTLLLLYFSLGCLDLNAQSADEKEILRILNDQTLYWNKGNIEEFMTGYWNNDSLTFIGKSGVTYGYVNTLNNYKRNYADTAAMGKLIFDILQVKQLSQQYYFVIGKYTLVRTAGNLQGHYSLLFKKIKGEWKIVSDHSS